MSFLDFCLSSSWERESGIQNLGIKENVPKVTYLIFRRGSTGESFFFHGLLDFVLFLILAWRTRVPHVSVFFCLQPGVEWLWFVCPLPTLLKNSFSYPLLPLRGGEPHFRFGGPSQSFGFSLFPLPVSGDLRLLSANICLSPMWPTFFLKGHFFDGLILSIQIWGVVILSPSSLWDITWHNE